MTRSASALVVVVAVTVALAAARPAHADGDPASDYLLVQEAFVPFDAKIPAKSSQRLTVLLREAKRRGYPIKVALIAGPTDLGSVTSLWQQPQTYARFLSGELTFVYRGRLLIVMPNGYGYARGTRPDPRVQRVLAALPPPESRPGDLAETAIAAVRRVAAVEGVQLPEPRVETRSSSHSRDRIVLAVAAVALLVLVLAGGALLRAWRQRAAG